jgi:hypothetical protein
MVTSIFGASDLELLHGGIKELQRTAEKSLLPFMLRIDRLEALRSVFLYLGPVAFIETYKPDNVRLRVVIDRDIRHAGLPYGPYLVVRRLRVVERIGCS